MINKNISCCTPLLENTVNIITPRKAAFNCSKLLCRQLKLGDENIKLTNTFIRCLAPTK